MLRLREFPDDEIKLIQTRKEKYTGRSGRNPETVFGTLEEDCMRRDLTINSLYYDISAKRFIDITGRGISDISGISDWIIRTPADPDLTYDDNPMCILRCLRFASRYGWDVKPATFAGMYRNADRLSIITHERIRSELDKMLTCANPVMALEMMCKCGAMQYMIPELCTTFDMTQNHYHFGTVWEHTLRVVENVSPDLTLRMAALLHDIGKVQTRNVSDDGNIHFLEHEKVSTDIACNILRRLKGSNSFINEVAFLIRHHMDLKHYGDDATKHGDDATKHGDDATKHKDKKMRKIQYIYGIKGRFETKLPLIVADNKAHAEGFCLEHQDESVRQSTSRMEKEGSSMFGYCLPLTGDDIMRVKGLKPGPKVKECSEYLMKLAFVNPLSSVEEFEKHLKGYHLNE